MKDKIFGLNSEGLKSLIKEMEVRETTSVSTVNKIGKDKECWAGPRVITYIWNTKWILNAGIENNVRKSVLDL